MVYRGCTSRNSAGSVEPVFSRISIEPTGPSSVVHKMLLHDIDASSRPTAKEHSMKASERNLSNGKVIVLQPLAQSLDFPRDDRSNGWTSCSTVRWGTSPVGN